MGAALKLICIFLVFVVLQDFGADAAVSKSKVQNITNSKFRIKFTLAIMSKLEKGQILFW